MHGDAIAARPEHVSSGALRRNMSTLYPGHAITAAGRRELASEKAKGERTASIVHTLMHEPR